MTRPDAATEAAFLRAICDRPDDDLPRRSFADWLGEHGDEDRAEFIRCQCDLASIKQPDVKDAIAEGVAGAVQRHTAALFAFVQRRDALRRRERELLRRTGDWLPEIGALVRHTMVSTPDDWWHAAWDTTDALIGADFSRGFVSTVTLPPADWFAHAPDLLAACPIRHAADGLVRLTTWPDVESYREAFGHYPIIPSIGPPPVPGDGSGYEWATVLPLCFPGVRFELPPPVVDNVFIDNSFMPTVGGPVVTAHRRRAGGVRGTGDMSDTRRRELEQVELELAERLFNFMERADPTEEGKAGWDGLTLRQREFYRLCVDTIIEDGDRVRRALDLAE